MQYIFEGPEIEVKVRPHGNSKTTTPFFKTSHKTKDAIRSLAASSTPKDVVQAVTKVEGGELEARGAAFLPRNRQQVKNFRRSVAKCKDSDVLYSVMLECKLAQGKGELFVQDVKAAPEPQSVLFHDWQADDLVRFCTNSHHFSVLTADTTFNLGEFFVTPMTYHHLLLENVHTGRHPIMVGPMLVHQRMQFSTFNYFANTLISHNKSLRNVLAFGTDGDKNLADALGHNFPFAVQLRCFLHFKKNIQQKLRDLAIPNHVSEKLLDDIFGKQEGNVKIEGLVDSSSVEDFDCKLEALEESWNKLELPHAGPSGPRFCEHFKRVNAGVVRHHMRKDIRESVGLGSPPSIFTTNASEAINSVLKKQVNYKKTQWPDFVQQMKTLVDAQRNEIIRSLSGRGQYRLVESYRNLGVSMEEWSKMRSDQRKRVVERFDTAQLTGSALGGSPCEDNVLPTCELGSRSESSLAKKSLDITAEESGIHTIPLVTLLGIWNKAQHLLNDENLITATPGVDRRARAVFSYSSETPHIVRFKGNGQYVCDCNCPQWVSSRICSHTVAVAQVNNSLKDFLEWHTGSSSQPNITSLAMSGMPSGRGRKKNQIPRSRGKKRAQPPDTIVSSPPSLADRSITQATTVHFPCFSTPSAFPVSSSFQMVSPQPASQSTSTISANVKPFYLKLITGNIRTCQGCRSTLRTTDGKIPSPPYDLAIARAERRPYRDTSGNLRTPQKATAAHYHCRIECVKAGEPTFVPASLRIPSDIYSQLCSVHREYLRMVFGLSM